MSQSRNHRICIYNVNYDKWIPMLVLFYMYARRGPKARIRTQAHTQPQAPHKSTEFPRYPELNKWYYGNKTRTYIAKHKNPTITTLNSHHVDHIAFHLCVFEWRFFMTFVSVFERSICFGTIGPGHTPTIAKNKKKQMEIVCMWILAKTLHQKVSAIIYGWYYAAL